MYLSNEEKVFVGLVILAIVGVGIWAYYYPDWAYYYFKILLNALAEG